MPDYSQLPLMWETVVTIKLLQYLILRRHVETVTFKTGVWFAVRFIELIWRIKICLERYVQISRLKFCATFKNNLLKNSQLHSIMSESFSSNFQKSAYATSHR
jgi:hypothetical protein